MGGEIFSERGRKLESAVEDKSNRRERSRDDGANEIKEAPGGEHILGVWQIRG